MLMMPMRKLTNAYNKGILSKIVYDFKLFEITCAIIHL